MPIAPLRVLVLTNHFRHFGGSELVALEVAEWFTAAGDQVTIGTNEFGAPMADAVGPTPAVTEIDDLALADFDIVWCQHDLLSYLPVATLSAAARSGRVPLVALASLGPSHPFEHLNAVLASAFSAVVYAGTAKVAAAIAQTSHGMVRRIRVLNNAAPDAFWSDPDSPPAALRRVVAISNHAPAELTAALELLVERGIEVRHLGIGGSETARVRPADIDAADAVVTIGKSVIYAVARRRPVYLYDHFGGDGWLSTDIWAENCYHNFAGQPRRRRLTAAAIADEIETGFAVATGSCTRLASVVGDEFRLGHHLAALRAAALRTSPRRRSLRLRGWLAVPAFRSMLEANRRKALLVRRFYLAVTGAEPEHLGTVRKWWWAPVDAERLADHLAAQRAGLVPPATSGPAPSSSYSPG